MEVEIARPSPAQMRKLHMGQPFRAKLEPGGLRVMASSKEAKKLAKASMKGSGVTLSGCSCCGCGMCGGAIPPRADPRLAMRGGEVVPKGNVKSVAKEQGKRLLVAGTDRAVRALEGSGLAEQAVRMAKSKAKKGMMGGEVVPKGNVKSVAKAQGKRLLVAGTDRAVRALEGSGMMDALITRAVMDGSGLIEQQVGQKRMTAAGARSAAALSSAMNMGGGVESGKISRRKKFNKWFKDIGNKFKPIAKNLKPIKQAATARAVDYIENYNNPQAQAQSLIDMAQKEYKDTARITSGNKKRGQSYGSASVRDDVEQTPVAPAGLRRGTYIAPSSAPAVSAPQPVDVNDDGEADGYFFPNEASWFGAGMPRGKRGFQGVRKALRHAGAGAPPTRQEARAMLKGGTMREIPPSVRPQPIRGGMAGRPTIQPVVRPQPIRGQGAKKTSPWIEHVKAYAKQHGVKYGEALKLAKSTYKSGGALYPAGYRPDKYGQ
jgi:hypothetical protein